MKLSVQLYSLREVGDFEAQLTLARACGFDWVESVATHGLAPADFAARLEAHGLRLSSMHVSLALLESGPAAVIEACQLTGCSLMVMPWLPMGERPASAAGWRALGTRLAALADGLAPHGLRLAYHNHDFEFLAYDGRAALEWLFDAATPERLGWEADLGWLCRAGADPWAWLERHGSRLAAVHVKDIAAPRAAVDEDGWAAVGRGVVPWDRLLPYLASRVEVGVFEHDKPANAGEAMRTSHGFMVEHTA